MIRPWFPLLLLLAACGSSTGLDTLTLAPGACAASDGSPMPIEVRSWADGQPFTGRVVLTSSCGFLDGVSGLTGHEVQLTDGAATVTFRCYQAFETCCTGTVKLEAVSGESRASADLEVQEACAAPDAGQPDASALPDAGPQLDASTPDAGPRPDASTPDAGPRPDAASTADAG